MGNIPARWLALGTASRGLTFSACYREFGPINRANKLYLENQNVECDYQAIFSTTMGLPRAPSISGHAAKVKLRVIQEGAEDHFVILVGGG